MDHLLRRMWREDDAQDLIEYVLLVALISTALVATLNSYSSAVSTVFSEAVSALAGGGL